jgi:hypothetical protein
MSGFFVLEGAMADVAVQFRYLTGLKRRIFRNARLVGNWDRRDASRSQDLAPR